MANGKFYRMLTGKPINLRKLESHKWKVYHKILTTDNLSK